MRRTSRAAFSLVEVVISLLILSTILVPIINMFVNSRRVSHSAGRMVEITLHCQMLLEALSHLEPRDLPEIDADSEILLLADGVALPGASSPNLQLLVDAFKKQPPLPMQRKLAARRLATGELALRIEVTWLAVVGEERTRQKATFRMLTIPYSWTR